MLSLERGLGNNTVLSLNYVGTQAHRLLVLVEANPGDPSLCLSLSNPANLAPGQVPCGAFGEDSTYTTATGQVWQRDARTFGVELWQQRQSGDHWKFQLQLIANYPAPRE